MTIRDDGRIPNGTGLVGRCPEPASGLGHSATIPCAVCEQQLENLGGEEDNQPFGATEMVGGGCYGSRITDCAEKWAINVCDVCLVRLGQRGLVAKVRVARVQTTRDYHLWEPEAHCTAIAMDAAAAGQTACGLDPQGDSAGRKASPTPCRSPTQDTNHND